MQQTSAVQNKLRRNRMSSYRKSLLLMMIPGLLFFVVYKYYPMYGVLIAFKNFRIKAGILGSPWAEPIMKNFNNFFKSPYCLQILTNTVTISVSKLVFSMLACIILAVLLSEVRNQKLKRFVQTVTYLPHFLSWVIIYGILYAIVSESSGLVNVMLRAAGKQTIPVLTNPRLFQPLLVFTEVWKNTGWGAIVYLAAIAGIDPGLYEAAEIDGASRMQRVWHVTLACIRPTILMLLILKLGSVLDAGFDQIYNLYNPQVYRVADIIDTWVYRTGLEQLNYSTATAVGLFKSVIGTILVATVNSIARRWDESLW
jgi:putative aldouronate transport system permease protein